MKLHAHARLSVKGRELLVARVEHVGWSLTQAAEAAGVSDRTAAKWLARYRAEGPDGLIDRCSAPVVVANRTDERRIELIADRPSLPICPEFCFGMNSGATPAPVCGDDGACRWRDSWRPASAPALSLL